MPSLKGSEVNPLFLDSPIHQRDIRADKKRAAMESLGKALEDWEALKKTAAYSLVSALADPKIAYFQAEVCKSIQDFAGLGWPVDAVKEYQAECRGALRQWIIIRDQPGMLQRQLEELKSNDDKEVRGEADEASKNKLKKFA